MSSPLNGRSTRWTFVASLSALLLAAPLGLGPVALGQDTKPETKPQTPPAQPETPPATGPATAPTTGPRTPTARPARPKPAVNDQSTISRQRPATDLAPRENAPAGVNAITPPAAEAAEAPVIRFEPAELDFGQMNAGVAMTKKIKIVNISDKPLTITRAVPGCGCTTPSWPKDPIAPGASGDAEITLRPGDKQGLDLHKKVTYQLDGHPPVVYSLKGHVAEYVHVAPDFLTAPPDGESSDIDIALNSVDGTAFKVVGVNPPVVKNLDEAAAKEHHLKIDWATWAEQGHPSKLAITTDHPQSPALTVMVKRPLNAGQPPAPPPANPQRAQSVSPVIQAVRAGDAAQLELLLAGGADANVRDEVGGGRTPLHWAVKENKKDLIPVLLKYKANLEAGDRVGKTPLAAAAEGKDHEMVKLLVEKGANVNSRDQILGSPLLWAAGLGTTDSVKVLLAKGAEVNVVDVNGLTPLLWAAGIGASETVESLVKAGAKVDVADKITGDTALMRSARTGKNESVAILLKAGAPVDARNNSGMTAFMLSATSGSVEKIQMLKDAGADVNAKDVRGWNAIDYAKNRIDKDGPTAVAFLSKFLQPSGAPSTSAPPNTVPVSGAATSEKPAVAPAKSEPAKK